MIVHTELRFIDPLLELLLRRSLTLFLTKMEHTYYRRKHKLYYRNAYASRTNWSNPHTKVEIGNINESNEHVMAIRFRMDTNGFYCKYLTTHGTIFNKDYADDLHYDTNSHMRYNCPDFVKHYKGMSFIDKLLANPKDYLVTRIHTDIRRDMDTFENTVKIFNNEDYIDPIMHTPIHRTFFDHINLVTPKDLFMSNEPLSKVISQSTIIGLHNLNTYFEHYNFDKNKYNAAIRYGNYLYSLL